MKLLNALVFSLLLLFVSCNNDSTDVNITITGSEWSAYITDDGFGEIHLNIAGSTDADTVTVTTYGDGEIADYTLSLDSGKNFNEDVVISFTHSPVSDTAIKRTTIIKAYKDSSVKEILLESPDLYYLDHDCKCSK